MTLASLEWWQLLLLTLPALINLWVIWHALVKSKLPFAQQILWAAISVFIPVLPGIFYFLFVYLRMKKTG